MDNLDNLDNNQTLHLAKIIYNDIFEINNNFEFLFMSVTLYINFKYEDIFSEPDVLELMARNNDIITDNLRLYPRLTRRQLESLFLTLNYFITLTLMMYVNHNVNHHANLDDDVD